MSGGGPRLGLPSLGDGVGLRDVHVGHLMATSPEGWGVDWFEIITENFLDDHGYATEVLARVVAHRPVVMHGVSLSIGGTDPLDFGYLAKVRALAEWVRPAWISDHVCWTGVNGAMSHDLLPVPLDRRCLVHVAERVRAVQEFLGRPLILENPSTYLEFQDGEMPEWEFIGTLAEETGCGLLLDVNNVFVSAFNHGFDAEAYIQGLPADRVVQMHLAGPSDHGSYLLDTHGGPVPTQVWSLYALAQQRWPGVATLLEWDTDIPPFPELLAELAKAAEVRRDGAPRQAGESGAARPSAGRPHQTSHSRSPAVKDAGAPSLAAIQAWMLAACTAPSGYAVDVEATVESTSRLPARARVAIYARSYRGRLLESLKQEFAVLHALVGDQVFDLFAAGYLEAHPPRSYSLFDLGAGFADFLDETRPPPAGPDGSYDALPAAIVRLERARHECGRDQGVETDPTHQPVDLISLMVSPDVTVRTPPSLHLLHLPFDLDDAFAAVRSGSRPTVPLLAATYYGVARSHFRVTTHRLEAWQHAFLQRCGIGGIALHDAATHAAEFTTLDSSALWASVLAWLPVAVDAGMASMPTWRRSREGDL